IAIFLFQVLEIARRVIAPSVTDVRAWRADLHANRAPAPIAFHIGAQTGADQVVPGVVLLNLRERLAEIPQIKKGFPARVGGKSGKRVARIFALVGLVKHGSAGEHRSTSGGVRGGIPTRRGCKQSARVDRIDRNVSAICSIGSGSQLRGGFFARFGTWPRRSAE